MHLHLFSYPYGFLFHTDNALAYRKHPRNALALTGGVTPSTPFCQQAPKNSELNGVVNAQLSGVNPGLFGGPQFAVVAFGDRKYHHHKHRPPKAYHVISSCLRSSFL